MWTTLVQSPIFKGAVSGLIAAAAVDVHAFMTWKSVSDVKTYQWGTALFRWGQGIVAGAVTAAGYGALVG